MRDSKSAVGGRLFFASNLDFDQISGSRNTEGRKGESSTYLLLMLKSFNCLSLDFDLSSNLFNIDHRVIRIPLPSRSRENIPSLNGTDNMNDSDLTRTVAYTITRTGFEASDVQRSMENIAAGEGN